MRKLIARILATIIAAIAFRAGYHTALLRVYREAEFYIADEMLIICLDGDYNETFYEVGWDPAAYEERWNR